MSDSYKLVYRGEVLAGQHPAVVRKRLAATYGPEHLDLLFSGQPVVVKRGADAATAARLQALFKQAGARLQVIADETNRGTDAEAAPPHSLQLLPSGSPVLRDDERRPWTPRDVDTGSLSLADPGARLGPQSAATAPAVDMAAVDFELAPVGTTLGERKDASAPEPPDTSHLTIS